MILKSRRTFVGRKDDIERLLALAADLATSVVAITGEAGVGKTALANRVYDESPGFSYKLRRSAFKAGTQRWGEGLEDWLVTSIAGELSPDITSNASASELVDAILCSVRGRRTLLLLDNVETLNSTWLSQFVEQWATDSHTSLLLLTTTRETLFPSQLENRAKSYSLSGLKDCEAVELLKDGLPQRFDCEQLLEAANKVRNNPQQLLYLSWRDPQTTDELKRLAKQLGNGGALGGEEGAGTFLSTIQQVIEGPVTHFLALGRTQTVEIEEDMLAWLWDRLGGGAVETYLRVRQQLIDQKFLTRRVGDDAEVLQIHPSVHLRLEKQLNRHIGCVHVANVDYFLSEYYRGRFQSRWEDQAISGTAGWTRQEGIETLLGRYVFHALEGGNLDGAFAFVFSPDRLRRIHHMGLAVGLRRVLSLFDEYIEKQLADGRAELEKINASLTNPEEDRSPAALDAKKRRIGQLRNELPKLTRYGVEVKIELAHCDNDLSSHEECLKSLGRAEEMLKQFADKSTVPLGQRINYLKGISYSDLGRSDECVKAYCQVVRDHAESGQSEELAILALGYLAFELRFHDMVRAETLGMKALEWAQKRSDPSLIAKSCCSLGQTQFFQGNIDVADQRFEEARTLCLREKRPQKSDRRELGRVLIHQAMVLIAKGKYDSALKMLKEGESINRESGDRRRVATGKALQGITRWRQYRELVEEGEGGLSDEGKKTRGDVIEQSLRESKELLQEAIKQHYEILDWRNLPNDCLSYAYILGFHSPDEAVRAAREQTYANERWAKLLLSPDVEKRLRVFGSYWASYFRPRLLEEKRV